MYQYLSYDWKKKEYTLAYGFYIIFRKVDDDFVETSFYEIKKEDVIIVPAINMHKEYIVTQPHYLSIDLPEGTECIGFKDREC